MLYQMFLRGFNSIRGELFTPKFLFKKYFITFPNMCSYPHVIINVWKLLLNTFQLHDNIYLPLVVMHERLPGVLMIGMDCVKSYLSWL